MQESNGVVVRSFAVCCGHANDSVSNSRPFLPIKRGFVSRHMQTGGSPLVFVLPADSLLAGAGASLSGSCPGCHCELDIHIALNNLDTK